MMISKEEKMDQVTHEVEPITKKDLRKMFWYSIPFYSTWSMERQAASGCLFTMMPLLKKLYKDQPEKLKESLVRNNELYAIADQFHEFVAGVLISMEEENAKTDGFDTSAISNVKVALMGPLAGVGDSFFLGTLRVLAIGIGASLMAEGNPLGILMFILVWNVPCFLIKYFGTFLGYRLGANFITKAAESGIMQKIMEAAGMHWYDGDRSDVCDFCQHEFCVGDWKRRQCHNASGSTGFHYAGLRVHGSHLGNVCVTSEKSTSADSYFWRYDCFYCLFSNWNFLKISGGKNYDFK